MPAAIRFRCYHCHRVHAVDENAAGRRGRCVCGKLMVVPARPGGDGAPGGDRALPMALPSGDHSGVAEEMGDVPLLRGPGLAAAASGPALSADPAARPAAAPPPEPGDSLRPGDGEGTRPAHRAARAAPSPVPSATTKGASAMSGTIYVILSLFALAAWVFHQFFTGEAPAFGVKLWEGDPNYLSLPAAFWSTVLFALFLALALEGIHRARAAGR